MNKIVSEYIKENRMINEGDTVLLALSGGADSVYLLFALKELQDELYFKMEVMHVEHGIRGQESLNDAQYVEQLCGEQGIAFHMVSVDALEYARDHRMSLEEAARVLRFEQLNLKADELQENTSGMVHIATAHNADDNAETMLFRIARGSSLDGICGIAPVNGRIIHPLLKVRGCDIRSYLDEAGIMYCVDSTNSDTNYDRNKIRKEVIPILEQINSKAVEHMNDTMESLTEVASYVRALAGKNLAVAYSNGKYKKGVLILADPIVRREGIHIIVNQHRGAGRDVTSKHIKAMDNLLQGPAGKSIDLPNGLRACVDETYFYIENREDSYTDEKLDRVEIIMGENADYSLRINETLYYDIKVRFFRRQKHTPIPSGIYTKWFDCDKIEGDLCLRSRNDGDYITVTDQGNTKKLSDYFINEKVPKNERNLVPLIANGDHIVWALGYRISSYFKVNKNTKNIMEITISEEEING